MTEQELESLFKEDNEKLKDSVFNKDSSEYKKSTVENGKLRKSLSDRVDPLSESLQEATHLDDDTKDKYIDLAELYTKELEENIFRNQFELARAYPKYTYNDWNDFLVDRIVATFVSKHKRTLLKAAAEDNLANPLAKNKRDNLQLIKNIEDQQSKDSKNNICIIRIPDIYSDGGEEDGDSEN